MRVEFVPGVLVRVVRPGSSAHSAGLEKGTIITQVMKDSVASVADLVDALDKHSLEEGVRVKVMTPEGGRLHTSIVFLELPKEE